MEACFVIDGKKLYTDHILVEYNGMPVFFVCKNINNYFMVLCTDIDKDEYMITPTNLVNISRMFQQQLTMREIISTEKYYWEVKTADDPEDDIVVLKDMKKVDESVLPTAGANFIIATEDIRSYAEDITFRLIAGKYETKRKLFNGFKYEDIDHQVTINIETNEECYGLQFHVNMELYEYVCKLYSHAIPKEDIECRIPTYTVSAITPTKPKHKKKTYKQNLVRIKSENIALIA